MKFKEALNDLKNHVGSRNGMLPGIARRGLNEGMTPEEVCAAFAETDCGDPPLTAQEVERAVHRSVEYATGEKNTGKRYVIAMRQVKRMLEGTSPEERGFVKRMISLCTDENPMKALLSISPIKIRSESPRFSLDFRSEMAIAYIKARFPDDDCYIFATDNIKSERERTRVYRPSQLAAFCRDRYIPTESTFDKCCVIVDGGGSVKPKARDGSEEERARAHNFDAGVNDMWHFSPMTHYDPKHRWNPIKRCLPTHIGVNPVDGTDKPTSKNGRSSYANKNTVQSFAHMLIEFDTLDLKTQCRFWYGAITSGSLDVLTIVFTGNKSLHGIVRVDDLAESGDLFGAVTRDARVEKYNREYVKMCRLCGSCEDTDYRCDLSALKDCARLTRFPGGRRDNIDPMLLVWCAKPDNSTAKVKWF